eukprot:TRINITY_DN4544_c0_g1_i1.p1 TRINITY_DN4544_c0_g1~~TRINITY_DN4544_c0_g1_i1.p1  ORF type:complete len:569 (+),score=85.70 TRINITY_DN4544_c0_g1_i1:51-1757(+)
MMPQENKPILLELLQDDSINTDLKRFLQNNDKHEETLFIIDVEEFRSLNEEVELRHRACEIYNRYFSSPPSNPLSFGDKSLRVELSQKIHNPTKSLFDPIQTATILAIEEMIPKFKKDLSLKRPKHMKRTAPPKSLSTSNCKGTSIIDKWFTNSSESSKKSSSTRINNLKSHSMEHISFGDQPPSPVDSRPKPSRQNTPVSDENQKKLTASFEEILLEPNFTIVKIVCEAEFARDCRDELFTAVVNMFVANELVVSLLKLVFRSEIQQSKVMNACTLFRGESPAVKLMSKYFSFEGKAYLLQFVRPLVLKITQCRSLEINSDRLEPGESAQANGAQLLQIAQEFIEDVCHNPSKCPIKFRLVFTTVLKEVKKLYPELGLTIVGSLLFLRYICPAITCPQNYGIDATVCNASKRALILISKLLQNLVNGVEFDGSKERYMVSLNCFITRNADRLKKFFEDIVDEDLLMNDEIEFQQNMSSIPNQPAQDVAVSLAIIRNYMYDHRDEVWDFLTKSPGLLARFKNLVFFGLVQLDFRSDDSPPPSPRGQKNSWKGNSLKTKERSPSIQGYF